jgi:hypothetical protein
MPSSIIPEKLLRIAAKAKKARDKLTRLAAEREARN